MNLQLNQFQNYLVLDACCKSVLISSVSGPAKDLFWHIMGQYDAHKMSQGARTVYKDFFNRTVLREHFIFFSWNGKWTVSSNVDSHIVV